MTPRDTDDALDAEGMALSPSDRLRRARIAKGYRKASEAARRFGWPISAYRSHDNGSRNFGRDSAEVYGKAFGVSASWLLGLTEEDGAFDAPTPIEDLLAEPTRAAAIADAILPNAPSIAEMLRPVLDGLCLDLAPLDEMMLLAAAATLRDLLLFAARDQGVRSDPRLARSLAQYAARPEARRDD